MSECVCCFIVKEVVVWVGVSLMIVFCMFFGGFNVKFDV